MAWLRRPVLGYRGQGAYEGCRSWWGVQSQLSWADRSLRGILDGRGCTVSHSYRQKSVYGRQEGYLKRTQCVRLFRDAVEVSGGLGGRLQQRRGHDWL